MWRRKERRKGAKRSRRWVGWLYLKPKVRRLAIVEWRDDHKYQVAQLLWNQPKYF